MCWVRLLWAAASGILCGWQDQLGCHLGGPGEGSWVWRWAEMEGLQEYFGGRIYKIAYGWEGKIATLNFHMRNWVNFRRWGKTGMKQTS